MIERIVVCGLGKLGAPMAAVFAMSGLDVIGLDLDAAKVEAINNRVSPVRETGLEQYLMLAKRLRATTDTKAAMAEAQACVFITPTPSMMDGSFDNAILLRAIETVATAWHGVPGDHLYIVASTVTPGTCDTKIMPLLSKIEAGKFHLVYKPAFIALGSVIRDLESPDLHLIGESSPEAGYLARDLYDDASAPSSHAPVKRMTFLEAELAKISLNCFITMKISFANQLAMVATAMGADAHKVLDAIGEDRRIGKKALIPGLPFGGPCFPRDARMFQYVANREGCQAPLALATDIVNDRLVDWIVDKAMRETGDIGILGMAYKPGTAVTEESAGHAIAGKLQTRNFKTHDPQAPHSHRLEDVLACPILIVAAAWPEYETIEIADGQILIDPMGVVKTRRLECSGSL